MKAHTRCLGIFALALASACRPDAVVQAEASVSSASTSAAVSVASATKPSAPTPDAWKKYWAAMKRGRSATLAKNYSDATKAFDEAIAAVPRDARARSERGYAKFLAGDNAGAATDFDDAIDLVPATDKKLAAQIYFNEGLAADKADAGAVAASYYRQSFELNATAAAKSKMASCPVIVASFRTELAGNRAAAVASIQAKHGGASASLDQDLGDDFVGVEDASGGVLAFALLPVSSSRVAFFETGVDVTMSVKGRYGDVGAEKKGSEWIVTCQAKVPGDSTCDPNEGPCTMTGPVDGGSHDVFYVDASSGAPLWHASYDFAFDGKINLAIENGKLRVTGSGCDLTRERP